jgi:hypothetical protein
MPGKTAIDETATGVEQPHGFAWLRSARPCLAPRTVRRMRQNESLQRRIGRG